MCNRVGKCVKVLSYTRENVFVTQVSCHLLLEVKIHPHREESKHPINIRMANNDENSKSGNRHG